MAAQRRQPRGYGFGSSPRLHEFRDARPRDVKASSTPLVAEATPTIFRRRWLKWRAYCGKIIAATQFTTPFA